MEEVKYLTVTAVSSYLEYLINQDPYLGKLIVLGEVSSSRLSKGHLYFNLKDEGAVVRCVMFKNYLDQNNLDIKDGMKVLVYGKLNLYKQGGYYSIMCFKIDEFGKGDLYKAFLLLKEKLEKEGLFKEEYKKPIPRINEKIGVITALTAEAFNDIKITITRRFPSAVIYLYPSLVQGDSAPKALIKAINKANQDNLVDVIIVGRGGGSIEDLWAFNEIEVIQAIYDSKIPIVTAIGHETDYTISDFVSDKRAPTPTAAAELVTPNSENLKETILNNQDYILKLYLDKVVQLELTIAQLEKRLDNASPIKRVSIYQSDLLKLHKDLIKNYLYLLEKKANIIKEFKISMKNPQSLYKELKLKYELLNHKLNQNYQQLINIKNYRYQLITNNLKNKDPLLIMNKGFGLITKDEKVIVSIHEINLNDELEIKIKDGQIKAIVKEKREK